MSKQNNFGVDGRRCPTCKGWFSYKSITKHQSQCQKTTQPTPAKSILSSLSSLRRSRLLYGAAPAPSETMTTWCATSGDVADTSTKDDEDDHNVHHNDNRKPPSSDDAADTSTMHNSLLLLKDHTQPPVGLMGAVESMPSHDAVDVESMIDNNHQPDDVEDENDHDKDHHNDNRKPQSAFDVVHAKREE
jgi:hypothetical protein